MGAPGAQMLVPLAQQPTREVFLIARSIPGQSAAKLSAAVRNAIRDLDPDITGGFTFGDDASHYASVVTGSSLREGSVRDFLTGSAVAGGAGSVILTLAALGIYGVVGLMV